MSSSSSFEAAPPGPVCCDMSVGSFSRGLKSTTRSSLTAKTVSVASQGSSCDVLAGVEGGGCRVIGAYLGVDLSDAGLVSLMRDHQMDMCGTHRMSINRLEQLPRRTVLWKRVCSWSEAVQAVFAILVGLELSAQVVVALVRGILEVIFAVAARLPHVEGDIGDRVLGLEIAHDAVHVGDGALVGVLDDAVAQVSPWGVGAPEWSEDSCGGWDVVWLVDLDVVGNLSNEAWSEVSMNPNEAIDSVWYSRFQANDIRQSVHLVPLAI